MPADTNETSQPEPQELDPQPVTLTTSQDLGQSRYQKTQAIFAKHNLPFDEQLWGIQPRVQRERVTKAIRMRVRYTCHECQTGFGHDRVCNSCHHRRCVKCNRYPPRRDRKKTTKQNPGTVTQVEAATTVPDPDSSHQCACHECRTDFEPGIEECPNCHHTICERCLRETVTVMELPEVHSLTTVPQPKPPIGDMKEQPSHVS